MIQQNTIFNHSLMQKNSKRNNETIFKAVTVKYIIFYSYLES